MGSDEQAKLLAAAIYEIRLLLVGYLGSDNEGDTPVRLASHLAYALHEDAAGVINGKADFNLEAARERIRIAENIVGSKFDDGYNILKHE